MYIRGTLHIFENKPPPQSGPCLLLKKGGLIFSRVRYMHVLCMPLYTYYIITCTRTCIMYMYLHLFSDFSTQVHVHVHVHVFSFIIQHMHSCLLLKYIYMLNLETLHSRLIASQIHDGLTAAFYF